MKRRLSLPQRGELLLRSLARMADIGGTMGIPRWTRRKTSDFDALKEDWEAIGLDIHCALQKVEDAKSSDEQDSRTTF